MKRLVLLATVSALLIGMATTRADAGSRSGRFMTTSATAAGHPVTLTWLRNNMPGFRVGPSRPTGYGRAELAGFTRGCWDCTWYRVTNQLSDHQPTAPVLTHRPAVTTLGGWCWPWENFPWSGNACWNDMSSWNWGKIFDNFNYQPVWDPRSTSDRIVGCYHGSYDGFTGGVIGKQAIGLLLDVADLVKVTPAGVAYTIVGGCVFSLFHH